MKEQYALQMKHLDILDPIDARAIRATEASIAKSKMTKMRLIGKLGVGGVFDTGLLGKVVASQDAEEDQDPRDDFLN